MKQLQIQGKQEFMGMEIPIIEGGFGEGKRCLTDKTIAEIHQITVKYVRELINRHIKRFKENIDLVDLKQVVDNDLFLNLNFTKAQVGNSKHIYLLSERGYAKLIKIMDNDLSWEIHDKLMDEYFIMKEVINSNEQLKAMALLKATEGKSIEEKLSGITEYTNIKVEEATKPLIEKIEEDKPLVTFADRVLKKGDNVLIRELAKIISDEGYNIGERKLYDQLRQWGYIFKKSTEPTQRGIKSGYFVVQVRVVNTPYGEKQTFTTKVTPKGQIHIVEKILKQNNI